MTDRKATDDEVTALVLLVSALRPNWANVAYGYVAGNAELMDVATLCRRAIGAATDPGTVLPSDMLIWEPPLPEVEASGAKKKNPPASVPIEVFNKATRCGHGAITGQCALCREGIPAPDKPIRGLPRPADPAAYVEAARAALADVEPPARVDKKPGEDR